MEAQIGNYFFYWLAVLHEHGAIVASPIWPYDGAIHAFPMPNSPSTLTQTYNVPIVVNISICRKAFQPYKRTPHVDVASTFRLKEI